MQFLGENSKLAWRKLPAMNCRRERGRVRHRVTKFDVQ